MSWIQKLKETYECCAEAPQFTNNPPLPISHTTQKAHIEIVLDGYGNFRRANIVGKQDQTTVVPCTEESSGRTGKKPKNHPLCDKLQYVAGDYRKFGGEVTVGFTKEVEEPHGSYLKDLEAWETSAHGHPKLTAVLNYVKKNQVVHDLIRENLLPLDSYGKLLKKWGGDKKDTPTIFKEMPADTKPEDAFIRWRIEIPSDPQTEIWKDKSVMDAWIGYYASQQTKDGLCMVTGHSTKLAEQHPAKIRNAGDKAKLISSNDTSGYTFRGRFIDADQTCGVGFVVTQQAHNALRWLLTPERKQAFRSDDQFIVAWAVSGEGLPDPFADSARLFGLDTEKEDVESTYQGDAGQTFSVKLNKYIAGYRATLGSTNNVVVMAIDSATTGRMAITYYRELTGSDFLDRVQTWHEALAWHQNYSKDLQFVGAPSPKDISESAYGRRKDDTLKKLHKATVQRLLPCIIDGQPIPRDLIESTIRRACKRTGMVDWEFEKQLGIACAIYRGYFKERNYQMALETNRTSRDYLYGRLLAIAESIESFALTKAEKNRNTTAARLMQRFSDRPYSTWRNIELALTPYKSRLRSSEKGAGFLFKREKLLDEVLCAFHVDDFTKDHTLSGEFLLGYHCQRKSLRDKPSTENDEDNTDN